MDAGSSQTTTSTCWAAWLKVSTLSCSPAAVSTIITSTRWYRSLKARMMPACSVSERLAMRLMPEAAGTICSPWGPVTMASSRAHSPLTTCPRWNRVFNPSTTSTFASPKSASTSITSRPCAAIDTARFADTVVLPTPPLPPVTAMTLTGREALSSSRVSAWLRESRVLDMGVCSFQVSSEVSIVETCGSVFAELLGRARQPQAPVVGCVQVLGDPLAVAQVGDPQLVPQYRRERGPQAGRLVHLGQNAGVRSQIGERPNRFVQRVGFAVRRKRQKYPRARGAEFQGGELLLQTHIPRSHAGGVDQDQFLGFEALEGLCQFLAAVRGVQGSTEQARIRHQ